jgi:SAM-dependent methyltransferase
MLLTPITDDAFSRLDEGDDADFYARDRLVDHLDTVALKTIEEVIREIIVEPSPIILDLMASVSSHLSVDLHPKEVIGLGLNPRELEANPALTRFVLHDINKHRALPFSDRRFDVVLNTVSIDYCVTPFDLFSEVARILKPGGVFIVSFSNRMFPSKAVKI